MSYRIAQGELPDPEPVIRFIREEVDRQVNEGVLITHRNMSEAPEFVPLIVQVRELVENCYPFKVRRIQAWGIQVNPGKWANAHIHDNVNYTGLFYLTGGAPIVLMSDDWIHEKPIDPEPGRMLTFPGTMLHRIERQPEPDSRFAVGMAFN